MVELSGRYHVLIMSFVYSVCFEIFNNKAIIILKAKHETESNLDYFKKQLLL